MKKVLLASAALLVAGMVSASAAPVKLSVGGYANWYTGYVDGNAEYDYDMSDYGYNHVPVLGDVEVHFKGETALQNGVKIGAVIELSGISDEDGIYEDQSYIYVDTAYGRFVAGEMDSISKQFHTASKDVGLLGIQDSDIEMFNDIVNGMSTDIRMNDDAATIAYISPKFAGFTLAASYSDRGNDATHNFEGNDAVYMGTLAYENTFGSVKLAADVSYAKVDVSGSVVGDTLSAGVRVGVAGFTFGAGYKYDNRVDGYGDINTFDVGVAYENGPYGVSLSYIHENEDADYYGLYEKDEMYLLSGAYNITEGVDTFVSVAYVKDKLNITPASKSYVVATGLGLSF